MFAFNHEHSRGKTVFTRRSLPATETYSMKSSTNLRLITRSRACSKTGPNKRRTLRSDRKTSTARQPTRDRCRRWRWKTLFFTLHNKLVVSVWREAENSAATSRRVCNFPITSEALMIARHVIIRTLRLNYDATLFSPRKRFWTA